MSRSNASLPDKYKYDATNTLQGLNGDVLLTSIFGGANNSICIGQELGQALWASISREE